MEILPLRYLSVRGYRILVLLASLLGLCAIACSSTSTPTSTPVPVLKLKGKLILEKLQLKNFEYVSSSYFELQDGWTEPRETDRPLPANVPHDSEILAVSPDKQYFALAPSSLFNVKDGKFVNLKDSSDMSAAFSPDGKHLAFQVPQEIWVRDIETGESTKIFTSDCAEYQTGERCEGVSAPAWADANTVVFAYHEGLPFSYEIGSDEDPSTLNAVSVVDHQGKLILSARSPAYGSYLTRGETVFGYKLSAELVNAWFDPAELSSGAYTPHSLCLPDFPFDCSDFVVPVATASPDGSKILAHVYNYKDPSVSYWYLLEVKTSKITRLGTPTESFESLQVPCLWSPDGANVACITSINDQTGHFAWALRVIPLSQEAGQVIATFPADPSQLRWELLEWQP